jgi:signal transduction histidine kinase
VTAGTTATGRRLRWPWLALAAFVVLAAVGAAAKRAAGGPLAEDALFIVIFFGYGVAGALIATRMPGNRIGALLLYVSGISALAFAASQVAALRMLDGHAGASEGWLLLVGDTGWLFGLLPGLLLLLQLFPDGRPLDGRWRWLVWGTFGLLGFFMLALLGLPDVGETDVHTLPNPLFVAALGPLGDAIVVGFYAFIVLMLASVVALVVRFRRSEGGERQQIRWMAFAAVLVLATFILSEVLTGVGWSDTATSVVAAIGIAGVPAAIGIAVLRYHLWDLDIVVRKAVLAAFVVVILMAAFGVVSYVAQATVDLGANTDVIVAALVGLAAFPAFRLARRLADRVVYGGRATPYEVLAGFADRVDVWLGHDGTEELAATWPVDASPAASVAEGGERSAVYPIEFNGELLGRLGARMGPGERMNGTDHKLIANLAAQAGPLLHNVSLTETLKARLAELHAARRRLVAAQDEERRRLERNIHDGAQQQLVALAVKLRLADATIDRDTSAAHAMLATLQEDATTALEDLRDLARGVYPPLLADQGLAAALDAQARRSPVPVHVRADGIGRLPVEVEAAVYFTCLEGLQNVAKYAEASAVDVALARVNGHLEFSVRDDGRGFDPAAITYGTGLQGMADRLAALDGDLEISSAPGRGTTITGRVPVADGGGAG